MFANLRMPLKREPGNEDEECNGAEDYEMKRTKAAESSGEHCVYVANSRPEFGDAETIRVRSCSEGTLHYNIAEGRGVERVRGPDGR